MDKKIYLLLQGIAFDDEQYDRYINFYRFLDIPSYSKNLNRVMFAGYISFTEDDGGEGKVVDNTGEISDISISKLTETELSFSKTYRIMGEKTPLYKNSYSPHGYRLKKTTESDGHFTGQYFSSSGKKIGFCRCAITQVSESFFKE